MSIELREVRRKSSFFIARRDRHTERETDTVIAILAAADSPPGDAVTIVRTANRQENLRDVAGRRLEQSRAVGRRTDDAEYCSSTRKLSLSYGTRNNETTRSHFAF